MIEIYIYIYEIKHEKNDEFLTSRGKFFSSYRINNIINKRKSFLSKKKTVKM